MNCVLFEFRCVARFPCKSYAHSTWSYEHWSLWKIRRILESQRTTRTQWVSYRSACAHHGYRRLASQSHDRLTRLVTDRNLVFTAGLPAYPVPGHTQRPYSVSLSLPSIVHHGFGPRIIGWIIFRIEDEQALETKAPSIRCKFRRPTWPIFCRMIYAWMLRFVGKLIPHGQGFANTVQRSHTHSLHAMGGLSSVRRLTSLTGRRRRRQTSAKIAAK